MGDDRGSRVVAGAAGRRKVTPPGPVAQFYPTMAFMMADTMLMTMDAKNALPKLEM